MKNLLCLSSLNLIDETINSCNMNMQHYLPLIVFIFPKGFYGQFVD